MLFYEFNVTVLPMVSEQAGDDSSKSRRLIDEAIGAEIIKQNTNYSNIARFYICQSGTVFITLAAVFTGKIESSPIEMAETVISGKSFADNSRSFISYTNYSKYLNPIQTFREVAF